MNIFILSEDPVEAAQMQCDQHVIKMTLETGQLLCSVFEPGIAPYKRTHFNHPCSIWTRESKTNFLWLCDHGDALGAEYTYRYNKTHASAKVILWCRSNIDLINFTQEKLTPFAIAMDEKFKKISTVESYRNFYRESKSSFAKWQKSRPVPDWFK